MTVDVEDTDSAVPGLSGNFIFVDVWLSSRVLTVERGGSPTPEGAAGGAVAVTAAVAARRHSSQNTNPPLDVFKPANGASRFGTSRCGSDSTETLSRTTPFLPFPFPGEDSDLPLTGPGCDLYLGLTFSLSETGRRNVSADEGAEEEGVGCVVPAEVERDNGRESVQSSLSTSRAFSGSIWMRSILGLGFISEWGWRREVGWVVILVGSGGVRGNESPSLSVHSSVSLTCIRSSSSLPLIRSSVSFNRVQSISVLVPLGGRGRGREGGGLGGAVRGTTWTEPFAKGSASATILERAKG